MTNHLFSVSFKAMCSASPKCPDNWMEGNVCNRNASPRSQIMTLLVMVQKYHELIHSALNKLTCLLTMLMSCGSSLGDTVSICRDSLVIRERLIASHWHVQMQMHSARQFSLNASWHILTALCLKPVIHNTATCAVYCTVEMKNTSYVFSMLEGVQISNQFGQHIHKQSLPAFE